MKIDGREVRAVWWDDALDGGVLAMIDQRMLPFALNTVRARSVDAVAGAIRNMTVRGAPTIGATAAFGMVLGADDPEAAYATLAAARPTARDLFTAIDHMLPDPTLERAQAYVDHGIDMCRRIGAAGAAVLEEHARADGSVRVLTHCHAGAFATVDIGTALSPFHHLAGLGNPDEWPVQPHVWVDETRPRLQGAITSWELGHLGVANKVIADNAAGHVMAQGDVDMVLVGADRIAANGDVANKIGTYSKAVLAHAHGVPFYVAAPATTFDDKAASGSQIVIEERDPDEVLEWRGEPLFARGTAAFNPAFDVTPARLVTGYLTEHGLRASGPRGA